MAASLALNVGLAAALGAIAVRRLVSPVPSGGRAHRAARADHLAELDARPGRTPSDVVVLGDSLVERAEWSELLGRPILNRGISGDHVADVAARLAPALAAPLRTVVLSVGVNDLFAGTPPAQVAAEHARLVAAIRALRPEARLVVVALLPVNEALLVPFGDPLAQAAVAETNRLLARDAAAAGVAFVDPSPRLARADGQLDARFTNDGVHLVAAGYRNFAEALAPLLP
jgi:lysophospholipase L1-like esterase